MLIFDLETDGLVDTVTKIVCCHLFDTESPELGVQRFNDFGYKATGDVAEGVAKLGAADEILAHNGIGYDYQVLDKLYPEWNFEQKPKRLDSIVMSSVIYPDVKAIDFTAKKRGYWVINNKRNHCPDNLGGIIGSHSLKAWGLRLGNHKDDYDPRSECPEGVSLSEAWQTVGWTEAMDDYCVVDVEVTVSLYNLLAAKNYSQVCLDLEHSFASIMKRQEANGFTLDVEAGRKLHQTLMIRQAELEESIGAYFPNWYEPSGKDAVRTPKVKNGPRGETAGVPFTKVVCRTFNAGSTTQIADRLVKLFGWVPTVLSESGEVSCTDEVLAGLSYPPVADIREYLVVSKRLGQLAHGAQAILKKVRDDGRIHGRVSSNGASTGRCTHSSPNVAQTPSNGAPYGKDFRALYTAGRDSKLVGADASGLELRCLAHFLARWDGGAYAEEVISGDVHWTNLKALGIADCDRDKNNPLHDAARNAGKTWTYGYLYGCGESLSGEHYTAALRAFRGSDVKAVGGRKGRKAFRENLPALASLEEAVANAATSKGYLTGLDGRRIPIRSAHSALNALLQGAGAVIMKQAAVILDGLLDTAGLVHGVDYGYCANVHDEWQIEVKDVNGNPELVGQLCEQAFNLAGTSLNLRVAIDGEAKIGNNWSETH